MLLDVGHQKSSSALVVNQPDMAQALTDPESQRLLVLFFRKAVTIAEAARATNTKPNTLYARVVRYVRCGLLIVEREVPRAGRALKLYRTTAERFFVPFEVMSFESLEMMSCKLDAYWERELRQAVTRAKPEAIGNWGYQVGLNARGELTTQTSVGPEAAYDARGAKELAVLSFWDDDPYLNFEDAKTLQRELLELYSPYKAKGGAPLYLIRPGLAARTL